MDRHSTMWMGGGTGDSLDSLSLENLEWMVGEKRMMLEGRQINGQTNRQVDGQMNALIPTARKYFPKRVLSRPCIEMTDFLFRNPTPFKPSNLGTRSNGKSARSGTISFSSNSHHYVSQHSEIPAWEAFETRNLGHVIKLFHHFDQQTYALKKISQSAWIQPHDNGKKISQQIAFGEPVQMPVPMPIPQSVPIYKPAPIYPPLIKFVEPKREPESMILEEEDNQSEPLHNITDLDLEEKKKQKRVQFKEQPNNNLYEKESLDKEWAELRKAKKELRAEREQLRCDQQKFEQLKQKFEQSKQKEKPTLSISGLNAVASRPPMRVPVRKETVRGRFKVTSHNTTEDDVQNLRATLTDMKQELDDERLEKRKAEDKWEEDRLRLMALLADKKSGTSDVHQESASTSAAKKAMQMAEEQIQVLKKENELLGSTIKKLHSDVEQLVDELNIERRGRKEGSGAVIEEVTMAKRRAKFLEGELAKAKSRLNCTIVELDQAKLDLMRKVTLTSFSNELIEPEDRSSTLQWSGESLWESTFDKPGHSAVPVDDDDRADGFDPALVGRLRKELERLRRAMGEQEHEVVVLASEVKILERERDVYKVKFDNLTAQVSHSRMMNRTFYELIIAADEEAMIIPSSIRRSQGSIASVHDAISKLQQSQSLTKLNSQGSSGLSFGSGEDRSPPVPGRRIPTQADPIEQEPEPLSIGEESLEVAVPAVPKVVRSKERKGTGFVGAQVVKKAGILGNFPEGGGMKKGLFKRPKAGHEPLEDFPQLQNGQTIGEEVTQAPVVKRGSSRKATGFVEEYQVKSHGPSEHIELKMAKKESSGGKKLMKKVSKDEMSKKKLMVKKKPGGPPATKSPELQQNPLPAMIRDLFPIYEEIEMRYLTTDAQSRAKLFKNLVKQLQESQFEMEQLVGEKEKLEYDYAVLENEIARLTSGDMGDRVGVVALQSILKTEHAKYEMLAIRCHELELEIARMRNHRNASDQVLIQIRIETKMMIDYTTAAIDGQTGLSLPDVLRDLHHIWSITEMSDNDIELLIPPRKKSGRLASPKRQSMKLVAPKDIPFHKLAHSHTAMSLPGCLETDRLKREDSGSVDSAATETYDLRRWPSTESEKSQRLVKSENMPRSSLQSKVNELAHSSQHDPEIGDLILKKTASQVALFGSVLKTMKTLTSHELMSLKDESLGLTKSRLEEASLPRRPSKTTSAPAVSTSLTVSPSPIQSSDLPEKK